MGGMDVYTKPFTSSLPQKNSGEEIAIALEPSRKASCLA